MRWLTSKLRAAGYRNVLVWLVGAAGWAHQEFLVQNPSYEVIGLYLLVLSSPGWVSVFQLLSAFITQSSQQAQSDQLSALASSPSSEESSDEKALRRLLEMHLRADADRLPMDG